MYETRPAPSRNSHSDAVADLYQSPHSQLASITIPTTMITTRTAKFSTRRRRRQQSSTLRRQQPELSDEKTTAQNGRHINNNKLLEAAFVMPRAPGSFGGVQSWKRYTDESYGKIKWF